MVTFTKLLVINIVANKRSESSRRKLIFRQQDVCVRQYHSCPREKAEKKAISEAESKAGSKQEHTSQHYGNNSRDRRSVYGNTVENISQLA